MSKLQKALTAIMAEVGYVQKDAKNSFHKYKYASADAVLTKVREACTKHGVAITESRAELVQYEPGEDHKGKPIHNAVVRLTQVYSLGEESVTFQGLGEGSDSGDKATMKANTAALKYLLSNAFDISWGDDPEADASTDEGGKTPKKRPSARRKKEPAEPSRDAVHGEIKAADTMEALEALRPKVGAFQKGSPDRKTLILAFKKREAELKEEEK